MVDRNPAEDCQITIDTYVVKNPSYDNGNHEESTDLSEIGLTSGLFKLEFSASTKVNTINVSDLMRRKLNSVDCRPKRRELIDEIPIIRESAGLASKLLWKKKVEKIVECELLENSEFKKRVETKEEKEKISQTDAIFKVYADYIFERNNKDVNKALIWIFKIEANQISEFCAELFAIIFLQRGANPLAKDEKSNTTLHYAARNGWTSIAKKLMEHKNIADVTNDDGKTPLEFAITSECDECATFLTKSMEPTSVRKLFEVIGCKKDEVIRKLSFYTDVLEKPNMQATVVAVLDKMIEPAEGQPGTYTVYFHILDDDRNGHAPICQHFNGAKKSCLYKIAKSDNKEVAYHDVVRLLLMHKWKNFAKHRLLIGFILFMVHTVIMTSALVLATKESDPRDYDANIDIFRGVCEAAGLICILWNILNELYQLIRLKKDYFFDYFNYLDIGAILFTLMIIPFRIVNLPIQWYFAALGYLCQTLQGFQYAAVFKSTGVYVRILPKIVMRDIIPFSAVFLLFLFAFTGAFYFSLRGEEFSTTLVTTSNCSSSTDDGICVQSTTTVESSSLNIFPHLTKEYYNVLFTNLKVIFQGSSIIADYFGPNGHKGLSIVISIAFLFLVITVLLNLLIAQMSDTYANVRNDAHRSLYINRAWIVAKLEDHDLLTGAILNCRKRAYIDVKKIKNPHDQLEKWEAPPISQVCEKLTKVHGLVIQQKAANEQSLKQVNDQLAANEQSLKQVNDQMRAVLQELIKSKNKVRRITV